MGPWIVLTVLTMSPTMDSVFPFLLWVFGGRQSARTIHFIVAFSFLGFFVIHIAALLLSHPWNGLRSMITGRFAIEKEAKERSGEGERVRRRQKGTERKTRGEGERGRRKETEGK